MKEKKVRYYTSFQDDFVQSSEQDCVLPSDYQWVRSDLWARFLSGLIYGLAVIFGTLYCRCFLHMRVKGRENIKSINGGFFVFGNHTQPVGDVFIPALCVLPRRIYTVVSTANYGIPVIGKILPYLGALPVINSLHGIKELTKAIEHRINAAHPVVIYPEAHVWEYYTKIRPFPDSTMRYPVRLNKPSFAMTVTYRKSRIFKRPVMEVFLDGPFYGTGETVKEKTENLHAQIYSAMQLRSAHSNAEYIEYQPR